MLNSKAKLAEIELLRTPGVDKDEFTKPADEAYEHALASEAVSSQLDQLARMMMQALDGADGVEDGVMDLSITMHLVPQAMYQVGVFGKGQLHDRSLQAVHVWRREGEGEVNTAMDTCLLALMECYAQDHAKTMRWEVEHLRGFIDFLFEARTVLGASFINKQGFGGDLEIAPEHT